MIPFFFNVDNTQNLEQAIEKMCQDYDIGEMQTQGCTGNTTQDIMFNSDPPFSRPNAARKFNQSGEFPESISERF